MKILKFLSFFLAAGLFLVSCTKDLSFEDGTAVGTLKYDASNECMPSIVNGVYKKDTALKATNYIDVQVNITNTGAYDIKTDTVNGYSFRGRGETAVLGLNTIRLLGSGKPLVGPSTDLFTVNFDTSHCEIFVTVLAGATPPAGPAATYTIDCTGATPSGTYQIGAATTGNTVTISATPSVLGTYTITTNTVNGVTFSGTGTFTGTVGVAQPVVLTSDGSTATGTAGAAAYTASAVGGTSTCTFNITYTAAAPPASFSINCGGAVIAGDYAKSIPLSTANTVTLPVTVTAAGSYTVSASASGVTFTGSGTFPNTAAGQTITLASSAASTSTVGGNVSYTTTGATTNCSFTVTYDLFTLVLAGTPMELNFHQVLTRYYTDPSLPGYNILETYGSSNASADDEIYLDIAFPLATAMPFPTQAYTTANTTGYLAVADYINAAGDDYSAYAGSPSAVSITLTTSTLTRIIGTYTGTVTDDATGLTKTISGSFNMKVH